MGIIVVILGIILMVVGVKKENKTLRNIGIAVALVGCVLTASSFMDGLQAGVSDTVSK